MAGTAAPIPSISKALLDLAPTSILQEVKGHPPHVLMMLDPRFGRTSELPGEDPLLNGMYAVNMLHGMQEKSPKGYMKMVAYLKHFTGGAADVLATDKFRSVLNRD